MMAGASCSEDYDIYPADLSEVLMIKDAGAHELSVYSTDAKTPFKLTVMKGGHTDGQTATATLRAMNQEEFDAYRTEAGTPYTLLPSNCFSFSADGEATSMNIQFAADETYKVVEVYINSAAFGTYSDSYDWSLYRPVLPVVLESADASINEYGVETFVLPTFVEPGLEFEGTGKIDLERQGNTLSFPINLPIENQWDITFKVELAPEYVEAYNIANGTSYTAADASAIKDFAGTYTMPKGSSSIDVSFTLDPSKLQYSDMVAFRLVECDVPGIVINPDLSVFMTGVTRRINITTNMFSTNALEPTEGSLANLLDDNPSTFFHSAWSVSVAGKHWLEVTLPEAYDNVQIEYWNRISGSTNTPAWFNLYTGTSDDDLTLFKAYAWDVDGLKGGSGEKNVLAPIYLDKPQNVFRIENTQSWNGNAFFVMTEFRMYTL